jgi:glutathione S-transferase
MLTIWGRTNSINVMKVLWACAEMDIAYTRLDAGLHYGVVGTDAYGVMNPNRRVPTILDGDFSLWESNVIVRYLAMRERRTDLLPGTPRGRADAERWMDWATSTLAAPMTTLFWQLIRTPEAKRDSAAIDAAAKECARCFGIVEAHLRGRDFLSGQTLTVADIAVAPFVHRWFALPVAHEGVAALEAYYRRMLARSAYRQHVALPLS